MSRFKGVTVHRLVRVWRKMRASHAVRSLLFLPSDKKIANKNVWISWSNAVISLASKQQIGTIAAPLLFFAGARAILRNRVLCNAYMGKGSFFNFLIRCIFPVQFLTHVDTCSILKIAIAEISRYRDISVIIHRKSPITMQRARRTSEFIKIKSSSTSGQFGLPPLLRNLVKPTSIYRARWASSFNEEASRWSSLTPTISSPCSLYSSFSLTCMKFCKHLPYMKM